MNLPGYDAWRLATPRYLDPMPPCARCGHEYEDHSQELSVHAAPAPCMIPSCRCAHYDNHPPEEPADADDWARAGGR